MKSYLPYIALVLAVFSDTAKADGMRCHSRLVNVGDTAIKLEQRCGPADFVTTQPATATLRARGVAIGFAAVGEVETIETRIYRGAPGRFATFVDIRRGTIAAMRLVQILTNDDPVGCLKIIDHYDEIGKVRLTCGAPRDASQWTDARSTWVDGLQVTQLVSYDRWFYDLGDGRFERVLTFENGILVLIETGARH